MRCRSQTARQVDGASTSTTPTTRGLHPCVGMARTAARGPGRHGPPSPRGFELEEPGQAGASTEPQPQPQPADDIVISPDSSSSGDRARSNRKLSISSRFRSRVVRTRDRVRSKAPTTSPVPLRRPHARAVTSSAGPLMGNPWYWSLGRSFLHVTTSPPRPPR